MAETFDAVVAGHICLDVIPDLSGGSRQTFEQTFRPGRLVEVGDMAFSTGGPVANTGLALDRLGIKTQLMGKTGDDLYGHEIRRLCARSNPHLADGMVTDPASSTSYTVVINPPQVDRIFLHFPGANDTFRADDVRYDLVERSRLFHFGYPPLMRMMYENDGRELAEIFRRAKATGVTTSLDMSLPDSAAASGRADWSAILRRTLPHVDIFLPSAEEILFMLRPEMHEAMTKAGDFLEQVTPDLLTELSDELLEMGAKIVVIKLGHRGFYLRTGNEMAMELMGRGRPADATDWANIEIWAPAFLVEEVGATGSGDSSIAGFTAALLRGLSPQEAVITATAVGACNVEAADGLSGILPWDETHARVKAGWEKRTLSITEPGWQFDQGTELWQKIETGRE